MTTWSETWALIDGASKITREEFAKAWFRHSSDKYYFDNRAWPWFNSNALGFIRHFNGSREDALNRDLMMLAAMKRSPARRAAGWIYRAINPLLEEFDRERAVFIARRIGHALLGELTSIPEPLPLLTGGPDHFGVAQLQWRRFERNEIDERFGLPDMPVLVWIDDLLDWSEFGDEAGKADSVEAWTALRHKISRAYDVPVVWCRGIIDPVVWCRGIIDPLDIIYQTPSTR